MSDELPSPRPWKIVGKDNQIVSADGKVMVPNTGYRENAEFIVKAVNEYDQMRETNAKLNNHVAGLEDVVIFRRETAEEVIASGADLLLECQRLREALKKVRGSFCAFWEDGLITDTCLNVNLWEIDFALGEEDNEAGREGQAVARAIADARRK